MLATWPRRPHVYRAIRGNFQASLIPPEVLAKSFQGPRNSYLAQVLSAGDSVPPQPGVLPDLQIWWGLPWVVHCGSQVFGNKLKSVHALLNL